MYTYVSIEGEKQISLRARTKLTVDEFQNKARKVYENVCLGEECIMKRSNFAKIHFEDNPVHQSWEKSLERSLQPDKNTLWRR